ncbi:MAG: hypothetical protein U1D30_04230 [Planctomycetota bacterium]
MSNSMTPEQMLLLQEHETATRALSKIDDTKVWIAVFQVVLTAVAVAMMTYVLNQHGSEDKLGFLGGMVATILFLFSLTGMILSAVLGRLSRAQFVSRQVIESVRARLGGKELEGIQKIDHPRGAGQEIPSRFSATYFLTVLIMIHSSFFGAAATYIATRKLYQVVDTSNAKIIAAGTVILVMGFIDTLYYWASGETPSLSEPEDVTEHSAST